MKEIKAIKIDIDDVYNNNPVDASKKQFVIPVKATVLSNKAGTLIQIQDNSYYLVTMGDWFRSSYNNKAMVQVDHFNQLQDYNLTYLKESIFRHKDTDKNEKQEIRGEDNVSIKKIDKTMASNNRGKKESKDRTRTI